MKRFLTKLGIYKPRKQRSKKDIPIKILKENSETFVKLLHKNISFCIENSIFLSDLRLADVTTAFKIKSKSLKDNCKPISILPSMSNIYER